MMQVDTNCYDKDCWKWKGGVTTDRNYGRVHLYISGDHMNVTAHRASYMAFNREIDLPNDISHRCHEKLCVNPMHLSHEPHSINKCRDVCRRSKEKKCTGHGKYKKCIL
jgi:hypothetical protein